MIARRGIAITARHADWDPQPGLGIHFSEDLADSMKINSVRAGAGQSATYNR